MNESLILLLTGVLFMAVFSLLSFVRREGISRRFLFESSVVTVAFGLLGLFAGLDVHPVVFLAILYVCTMRVRLLVDLGSTLARRGNLKSADRAFSAASLLGPDPAGALLVRLNQGACALKRKRPADAIPLFQEVLEKAEAAHLGVKYRSACHYKLGLAYWRERMLPEAERQLEEAQDMWPASTYARRAETALGRLRAGEGGGTT
jgi:tetratricopeptide (TPR) repeat protein